MEVLANTTEDDRHTLTGRHLWLLMLLYDFGRSSLVIVLLVAAIQMSRAGSKLMA